jgi:intracellular sulfur oxidation DsrE/DsrF family protein
MKVVASPSIRRISLSLAALLWVGLVGACVVAVPLAGASRASAQPGALPDKPFAEHRLVLQLSDSDPKKQGLVISVAYNLLKFYGLDRIAIEVVTFGPGIDLLRADNANRQLIDSLVAQGVRFDLCMNTVDTIERETGRRPQFNANAIPVEAGVAQILALTENGYTLVRP